MLAQIILQWHKELPRVSWTILHLSMSYIYMLCLHSIPMHRFYHLPIIINYVAF